MKSKFYSVAFYIIIFVPLLALVVAMGRYELSHPDLNWDLLPYVGLVEKLRHNNTIDLHNKAYYDVYSYAKLHASILASSWNELIVGPYREDNLKNAAVFNAQLPFYSCKPFYIFALYWISFFTNTITEAAIYLSAISGFILTGLIILFSCFKRIPLSASLIIGICFFFSPFISDIIRSQTPDSFATLFLIAASILFIAKHENFSAFVFLLSVLIRPELEIFCVLLAIILLLSNLYLDKKYSKIGIFLLFSSIILKSLVYHYYGAYSYPTLFDFTFWAGPTDFPNQLNPKNITFTNLLLIYRANLSFYYFYSNNICPIILWFFGLGVYFKINRKNICFDASFILYLSCVLYFIAHILLFPFLQERYFSPIFSVGVLILIDQVSSYLKIYSKKSSAQTEDYNAH